MELKTIAVFFLLSSLVVTICAKPWPVVPVLNIPEPVPKMPELEPVQVPDREAAAERNVCCELGLFWCW